MLEIGLGANLTQFHKYFQLNKEEKQWTKGFYKAVTKLALFNPTRQHQQQSAAYTSSLAKGPSRKY